MDRPESAEVRRAHASAGSFSFGLVFPRRGLETPDRTGQAKNLLFLASSLLAIGGTAAGRLNGASMAFFCSPRCCVFYPLIYYFTFPQPRYRHAIDPELIILAVFLISSFPAFQPHRQAATDLGRHEQPLRSRPWPVAFCAGWQRNLAILILLVAVVLAIVR